MNEQKLKEDLYHDFLAVRGMRASLPLKVRILTALFGANTNGWRVVGITLEALKVFASNDFKSKSGDNINRSHHKDRDTTYKKMLTGRLMNKNAWWKFYLKNDTTVLATSSENVSGKWSEVYNIDESLGLFRTSGFKWRHTKQEREFLMKLYEDII